MSEVTERAVLAGGCFWGMQDLIRKRPGVSSTRVGYTGGDVANATYRNHGSHAEAIEITFDPDQESFRGLLEFFFQIHDPTTKNRQGNDVGASYRSAIYSTSDEQRAIRSQAILDTAAAMLTEMPVAQLSLNDLSRHVGLAKSNVLRYFESRAAVLLELPHACSRA